ncbi:F0F1 ATP synthase subunit B [Trueperella bialowiezensis]|uniref:ATP synthase subunit b n=1 Tax=Trueperella bialowiezensis TaxID=312285 RepID=A0A448PFT2_9ACTO|nr:F0F1 ATP synthase subunit B [Trueperella bialowiezensis]VEI13763.1 F-type ATPase subunit b [Trueperella bialowiezensis]
MFETTSAWWDIDYHLLLPAPADLIWGTVAFAVVAFAVYKYGWPAFKETLDERAEKIDAGLKAAELARAEVADQRAQIEEEIRQAQREATGIRELAQDNAKAIVAEAQTRANTEAENTILKAQRRIDADTISAMRTLEGDIGELATDLAGRIVGEAIQDEALAHRVIDRFIDELAQNTPEYAKGAEA